MNAHFATSRSSSPMLGDLLPEPIRLTFPCGATKESYERRLFDWVTNSMNLLWRD